MNGGRLPAGLLLVTVVLASSFVDFRIRQFPSHAYTDYIPGVVNGTYGAPATYRVLAPFAHVWLVELTGWSDDTIWHLSRVFWFAAAYLALFWYLRTWFAPGTAAAGVLGVAATLPLTYTNSWAHPDAIPELALFTVGCALIARRRAGWLGPVLAVATLNRETAAFLVLAYGFSQPLTGRHVVRTLGFGAIWLSIFAGLRALRGIEHYEYFQLDRNLEFLKLLPPAYDVYKRAYAWFVVALAAPAMVVIALRWSRVPQDARRMLATAGPFLLVAGSISSIIETRIFIPLYALTLPALMFALAEPIRPPEDSRGA